MSTNTPQALALFSGGLDSILAAKLIMNQGIRVRCVHFTSPFFGMPTMVRSWKKWYGLDVECVDIGPEFVRMLIERPEYGFGKALNPCVDCKILMMRTARKLMEACGASFLISGEVLGQRPMSQRKDNLNAIHKNAEVRGRLLRPLCAKHLEPTVPELEGTVDRSRLLSIHGRGRKPQLDLAAAMGIDPIPTPAGGCRLAEKENALRYWAVLSKWDQPEASAFHLANHGRQFWAHSDEGLCWLVIGRHEADNTALLALAPALEGALVFKTVDHPGPMAIAPRAIGWSGAMRREAASLVASFSPKALASGTQAVVRVQAAGVEELLTVQPERSALFCQSEANWPEVRELVRAG